MRQLIIALIIALVAIIFALQNAGPVDVKFFFWELTDASLALVLIITLIIGVVTGMMLQYPAIRRKNKQASDLRKRMDELEKRSASTPVVK